MSAHKTVIPVQETCDNHTFSPYKSHMICYNCGKCDDPTCCPPYSGLDHETNVVIEDVKKERWDAIKSLTLEDAVRVLNEKGHNLIDPILGSKRTNAQWKLNDHHCGKNVLLWYPGAGTVERLTEFEAIACAEKYLREAK